MLLILLAGGLIFCPFGKLDLFTLMATECRYMMCLTTVYRVTPSGLGTGFGRLGFLVFFCLPYSLWADGNLAKAAVQVK